MHIIETHVAPNPRRVRIFLAEKGIDVDFVERDLMSGVLRDPDFTKLNPWQRLPVLVLDTGEVISETVAICRYFEVLYPEPSLFGRTAIEQATTEMWQRRVELGLFGAIAHAFRHLNPKMAHLEQPQIAAWGTANIDKVGGELHRLDAALGATPFVAGERFSIADITALVAIDFMKPVKLGMPPELVNIARWHRQVSARPSASA